jgi:hypothetical protein
MEELRYIYQRIGFLQFSETSFEDAGRAFLLGDLDPVVLISYFSSLRGSLIQPSDTRMVFAGVADKMPAAPSIDDISEHIFTYYYSIISSPFSLFLTVSKYRSILLL